MSQASSEEEQNMDREKITRLLTDLMDFATTIEQIDSNPGQDILEMSRDSTKRANARTRPEHKAFAKKFQDGIGTNSQEMVFGLALEFARQEQEAFAKFLSEYVLCEMQGDLIPPEDKIKDIEHKESTETEDSVTDDIDDVDDTPEGGTDDPDEQEKSTESDPSNTESEDKWDRDEPPIHPEPDETEQNDHTDW